MTILASDDFNRADAGSLGANWTNKRNAFGIFTNQADITVTADDNISYYSAISWPNDGYAQGVCASSAAAGRTMQVGYRIQSGANGQRSGYYGGVDGRNNGNNDLILAVWNVSTPTALGTDAGTVLAANDVIKITCVGTTITLYVNGVQKIQATDTLWSSGLAGMFGCNTVADVPLLDTFEGGDFGVGGGPALDSDYLFYQVVQR